MPPSLEELKVTPSFCFAFKIPDDVAASSTYIGQIIGGDFTKFCGLLRIYELHILVLVRLWSFHLQYLKLAQFDCLIWYDVMATSSWRAHIIWNHDVHCNQTKLYFWYILVWVRLWSFHLQYYSKLSQYDCVIWWNVLAPSSWCAHIIWNHDMPCNQTECLKLQISCYIPKESVFLYSKMCLAMLA